MTTFKAWLKDKWGRFITAAGGILTAAGTGIAALPDSANDWMPHLLTLTSAKVCAGVMLFAMWVASFMRHNKAAQVVTTLQQQAPPKAP